MTGRSHAQSDYPEDIAQFFISELHPERFSAEFLDRRHTASPSTSIDPVTPEAQSLLKKLESRHARSPSKRQRPSCPSSSPASIVSIRDAALADYDILLAESPEMAWISTEGNAFNHATDRVADVDQLAAEQKALGQPMKAAVETSQSGRVRQTAFHAARV